MKISALFSTVVLASMWPIVSAQSVYDCEVDGNFDVSENSLRTLSFTIKLEPSHNQLCRQKVLDDDADPIIPTAEEEEWAISRIMVSYNNVKFQYNPDFEMEAINITSYTVDENPLDVVADQSSGLRGGRKWRGQVRGAGRRNEEIEADEPSKLSSEGKLGKLKRWSHRARAKNDIKCAYCKSWDDDDSLQEDGTAALDESLNHALWVADWCEELRQGPYPAFFYVDNCAITLYNCATRLADPNAENKIDAEAIAGAIVVGAGMETIEAEADAEIAAQEMHEN